MVGRASPGPASAPVLHPATRAPGVRTPWTGQQKRRRGPRGARRRRRSRPGPKGPARPPQRPHAIFPAE
eukprot:3344938-Alexandrium_andersonii.AAC.1